MSSAPGISARAEAGAWGSFHDTHHHPAKDSAVVNRTVMTAPATPDALRTSLTATPRADAKRVNPITASLGTSPAGITLGTRQISQCTTYRAFGRLPAVMNIATTAPRTRGIWVHALCSSTFTTVLARIPVIPAFLASCAGSWPRARDATPNAVRTTYTTGTHEEEEPEGERARQDAASHPGVQFPNQEPRVHHARSLAACLQLLLDPYLLRGQPLTPADHERAHPPGGVVW